MSETAKIIIEGKEYEFPIIVGTEGEKAIDISKLRDLTGHITLDIGFKNTGSTKSAITFWMVKKVYCITADTPLKTLRNTHHS